MQSKPVSVGRSGRRVVVKKALSSNSTYNVVHHTSDPRAVLRLSAPLATRAEEVDARHERGLMVVAAHLGVHPAVEAASVGPLWGKRVAASLMHKHESAQIYLTSASSDVSRIPALVKSLFRNLCVVAELSLYLADIKFANVLFDARVGKTYLIDFDPQYVSYSDAALLSAVSGSCTRARGVAVYLMLLALYQQLLWEEGSLFERFTPRAEAARVELERLLRTSAVPLEAVKAALTKSPLGKLADDLSRTVWQYFLQYHRVYAADPSARLEGDAAAPRRVELMLQDAIDRRLFLDGADLHGSGPVVVGGEPFEDDARSCGGGRRLAYLAAFGQQRYPCASPAATAYAVDDDGRAFVGRREITPPPLFKVWGVPPKRPRSRSRR